MAGPPVNNPPAPVLESVSPAIQTQADCAAIKAKYDVISGKHTENNSNPNKAANDQSHHVFQDAAMRNSVGTKIVTYGQAGAVVLSGGSHAPGSEHAIANGHQNARSRKATKNPRPTMGDIRKAAKADIAAALQHGNPSRKKSGDSKKKFNKDMEILADCLVMEAEEKKEANRKARGKRPYKLSDDARTRPPRGCFALGSLIWLTEVVRNTVESLREGMKIELDAGEKVIARVNDCRSYLVEIDLSVDSVSIAPFHRLRLADGRYRCADTLRRGHMLATAYGPKAIIGLKQTTEVFPIHSFSLVETAACRIGASGLWAEIPGIGYCVSEHVNVDSIFSTEG